MNNLKQLYLINIWDSQNGSKVKYLINKYFNIGHHIATIRGTNMNPRVLQYKNYQKQEHTTYAYHIYRSKCQNYNKLEHHRDIV